MRLVLFPYTVPLEQPLNTLRREVDLPWYKACLLYLLVGTRFRMVSGNKWELWCILLQVLQLARKLPVGDVAKMADALGGGAPPSQPSAWSKMAENSRLDHDVSGVSMDGLNESDLC